MSISKKSRTRAAPNRLKEYRIKLGLSQVKLGGLVGLQPGLIGEFERGDRRCWPRARRILARTFGVAEEVLFPENGGQDARK